MPPQTTDTSIQPDVSTIILAVLQADNIPQALQLAIAELDGQRDAVAMELFEAVMALRIPRDYWTLHRMALIYAREGDPDAAYLVASAAIDIAGDNNRWHVCQIARDALRLARLDQAASRIEARLAERGPTAPLPEMSVFPATLERGPFAERMVDQQVDRIMKSNEPEHALLARFASLNAGNTNDCIAICKSFLAMGGSFHPKVLSLLARAYGRVGMYRPSYLSACFASALSAGDVMAENFDIVAAYLRKLGRTATLARVELLRDLENASLIDARAKGIAARKSGAFRLAAKIFTDVLAVHPGNLLANVNRYVSESHVFVEEVMTGSRTIKARPTTELLSICLPIFRRHENIREAICSVVYQICQMDEFVEVCIGDNFEGDENERFIKPLLPYFPFLRYRRNPFNIGADLNFYNLFLQGDCAFKMFIGDDDVMLPGALPAVLATVRKYVHSDVNHIFLNFLSTDLDISTVHYSTGFRPKNQAALEMSGEEAVNVINTELLRMTNSVTRRGPIVQELQKFIAGHYIVTLLIAMSALSRGRSAVMAAPVYVYREGDRSDWSAQAEWIMNVNVPTAFSVMNEAGYFSAEAVAPVFEKMGTSLSEWRLTHDLKVVSRERDRIEFMLSEQLDRKFDRDTMDVAIFDFCDIRRQSSAVLSGAHDTNYFNMDGNHILLHPNPPSSGQDIRVRFMDIPLAPGAELLMRLSVHPQGHAVVFSIAVVGQSDGVAAVRCSQTVAPGTSETGKLDLGDCDGLYELVLSTSVVEGAADHHFCSAWFDQLALISSRSKPAVT